MELSYFQHNLIFKKPSGTSRGILTEKPSWFIEIKDAKGNKGMGECSVIPGLSPDFETEVVYQEKLNSVLANLKESLLSITDFSIREDYTFSDESLRGFIASLAEFPSLVFGIETALLSLWAKNNCLFQNDFSAGKKAIPINGLIWMGKKEFMQDQIQQKLNDGFEVIKMKIGAIDFESELDLLKNIRQNYSQDKITLRVDANCAFTPEQAKVILHQLKQLDIHSIEQPIATKQWSAMHELCQLNDVPIALDEELIGFHNFQDKTKLLDTIQPPYIILKPSLHGGISGTFEWIYLAEQRGIKWWITSALESSVGLDAIAQFAGEFNDLLPQGLGTGSIYVNNFPSKLMVEKGTIRRIN